MANLSLARKTAIAFIKPFRSYLDGTLLLGEKRKTSETEIRNRIEALVAKAKETNPDIEDSKLQYAKNCLLGINLRILNLYDPSYEKVMPSAIDSLMISLERELVLSFSDEELEEVLQSLEKPGLRKLLTNRILFGSLKDCEFDIENKMRMAIYDEAINPKIMEEMKNAFENRDEGFEEDTEDNFDLE